MHLLPASPLQREENGNPPSFTLPPAQGLVLCQSLMEVTRWTSGLTWDLRKSAPRAGFLTMQSRTGLEKEPIEAWANYLTPEMGAIGPASELSLHRNHVYKVLVHNSNSTKIGPTSAVHRTPVGKVDRS